MPRALHGGSGHPIPGGPLLADRPYLEDKFAHLGGYDPALSQAVRVSPATLAGS